MADSIGDFVRTAIGFGNLQETRRRNDIYEENTAQELQRIQLQKQKMEMEKFSDLMKLSDDPSIKGNPEVRDKVLAAAWKAAKMPAIDATAFARSRDFVYETLAAMDNAVRTGDRGTATQALMKLQATLGTKDTKALQDSLKENAELLEYSQKMESIKELNAARVEKLHDGLSRVDAGLVPFSTASRDFFDATIGTDTKGFKAATDSYALLKGKGTDKQISALAGGELKRFGGPDMEAMAGNADQLAQYYKSLAFTSWRQLQGLERGEELPKGVTKRDLIERQSVGEELGTAYATLASWGRTPFDADKLKQVRRASDIVEARRKQLEGLKGQNQDAAIDLRQQALNLRLDKDTREVKYRDDVRDASNYVLEKYGYEPTAQQLAEGAKKFGVKPQDVEVKNPKNAGKLTIDVNDPTTAVRTEFQNKLTNIENTQNIIDNLTNMIQQENIGFAAAVQSTAYGFASQIKGLANAMGQEALETAARNKDFTPSKWFNPDISTVDLLANTLAYRLVNVEQGGRVSDKDIQEMIKRLGIKSMLAGKEDALQRLKTISGQLAFEASVIRRTMPNFGKGGGQKSISNASEYLESIGIKD